MTNTICSDGLLLRSRGRGVRQVLKETGLLFLFSLFLSYYSFAQTSLVVEGTITGEKGEALPGVSIRLKNTAVTTSTDVNGNYSFSVPNGQAALVFSHEGYVTREVHRRTSP